MCGSSYYSGRRERESDRSRCERGKGDCGGVSERGGGVGDGDGSGEGERDGRWRTSHTHSYLHLHSLTLSLSRIAPTEPTATHTHTHTHARTHTHTGALFVEKKRKNELGLGPRLLRRQARSSPQTHTLSRQTPSEAVRCVPYCRASYVQRAHTHTHTHTHTHRE